MMEQLALGREFFARLEREDGEIARRVAELGCRWCGGPLYRADYDRKPRGGLIAESAAEFVRRYSLCCGRPGCRRRSTPPSLRFLGRRVYVGAVVIAASVMALVIELSRAIREATGVPARTVRRWLGWWRGAFVGTEVFLSAAARFVGLTIDALPTVLVDRLPGDLITRLGRMLELLAPLTTSSVIDGSRFVRRSP